MMTDNDLIKASVAIIASGQSSSGAYIASPTFSQYGYAWLRDGSFCALAMRAAGETDSARKFHQWAANVIMAEKDRAESIIMDVEAGRHVPPERMLPTRYRLDGSQESGSKQWPNFQLDGYGTWLATLRSFYGTAVPSQFVEPVRTVARYLAAAWHLPCFDYWEENADCVHTSTLAAIAAGLRAASRLLDDSQWDDVANDVLACIATDCVSKGAFVKSTTDERVDGSLVSLAVPFGLVDLHDPRFESTAARIRSELSSPSGGIRRYVGDTYYGGSPWILLTAWLGWYDRLTGNELAYHHALSWTQDHANEDGTLPEQVVSEPQFPSYVPHWEHLWGAVANPLLWSHAQYLLLRFGGDPMTWD